VQLDCGKSPRYRPLDVSRSCWSPSSLIRLHRSIHSKRAGQRRGCRLHSHCCNNFNAATAASFNRILATIAIVWALSTGANAERLYSRRGWWTVAFDTLQTGEVVCQASTTYTGGTFLGMAAKYRDAGERVWAPTTDRSVSSAA
jgi:hypothetical protein